MRSIRHVLKPIKSERNVGFNEICRGKTPSSKFIVLKLFSMFVFSWAFNQTGCARCMCVCVNSLLTLFIITVCAPLGHDDESNTHTTQPCVYMDWFGGTEISYIIYPSSFIRYEKLKKRKITSMRQVCSGSDELTLQPVFRPSNEQQTNKRKRKRKKISRTLFY